MDFPTFLFLALVGFTIAGATVTLIGWHRWVQVARDLKSAHLRRKRAVLRQQTTVMVPPIVAPVARHNAVAVPPRPRPLPTASSTPAPAPTYTAAPLLTRGEQAFHAALREAVADQFQIMIKPRLADLVHVRQGRGFYRAFNQVAMKHIDFVLMDPATTAVMLLIELDDRTHRQYRRRQRDKLVNSVCREAGLEIMHIGARASYSPDIIRSFIDDRLRSRAREVLR